MMHAMTLNTQLSVPGQSIEAYTQAIRVLPMLTVEEEIDLAVRFRQSEDIEAARTLVMSHLRFVMHIANSYRGYGLPHADLIQEGNIGLMKAVKRFDPNVGVRLVSFAVHWIRAEIHEYILRNWRIVKVATTKPQRKLFFNLRSAKKRWGWLNRTEIDEIAKDLGVSPKDVVEMEKRLGTHDTAFDVHTESDEDEEVFNADNYVEDRRYDPATLIERNEWETYSNTHLRKALDKLDTRSQDILQRRWLSEQKATLQELADYYKVSAERIRQIEMNALQKLRKLILPLF